MIDRGRRPGGAAAMAAAVMGRGWLLPRPDKKAQPAPFIPVRRTRAG